MNQQLSDHGWIMLTCLFESAWISDSNHLTRIQLFSTVGWLGFSARDLVLKHSSFRSKNSYHDRSILMWQKQVREPNNSSSSLRHILSEYKTDLHGKICTSCMQWQLAMHKDNFKHHRAQTTRRKQKVESTFVLANVWRVRNHHQPSNWLFEDGQPIKCERKLKCLLTPAELS